MTPHPAAPVGGAAFDPNHLSDRGLHQPTALGLRAAPNPLLGRAADLGAIEDLVRSSRVTTVLGPGGTGKTRVANALGTRLAPEMPVVLVELASVRSDPEDAEAARVEVEAAISAVLGVGETARDTGVLRPRRTSDARDRLRDALSARAILLILDNCEHLVDAVAEVVADLIGTCDRLTVLTTSRSPLEITAETVYPLPPLAIDDAGSPATELFAARARAVRPSIRLDGPTVARLCRTLDGLPLAIELAAARARTLSVEEIETRLADRFTLLRSGDRSSPARHRTLHAVIEWSWNLLDEPQRIALRRLCRFPSGFTSAAAELVASADGVDDVAAAVEGLVTQSLLTVLEDETGTRYRMLETVREFGEEQLTAAGEQAVVMTRMARWAREFGVSTMETYIEADQAAGMLAMITESDNLIAVLRWACDTGDPDTVYQVFPVLGVAWMVRGAHMDLISWAARLLAIPPGPPGPKPTGDLQMASHVLLAGHLMYIQDDGMRSVARIRTRARRLLRSGVELNALSQFFGAILCARPTIGAVGRVLIAGSRSADRRVRCQALFLRANIRENAGDYPGSMRDALRGIEYLTDTDIWGGAMAAQHLGQLHAQAGEYSTAARHYRKAAENLLLLRAYDESVELRSYLAQALIGSGDLSAARRELELAAGYLDPGQGPDDPVLRPNPRRAAIHGGWAELALAEGDVDTGLRRARSVLPLMQWHSPESVTPGPGALPAACFAFGAHVLHGRTGEVPDLATEIIAEVQQRLSQFQDLPQLGVAACVMGSYLLQRDPESEPGLALFAAAPRVRARQDVVSVLWARHRDLHESRVGADRIDAAVAAANQLSRHATAVRLLALFDELAT
ncbi:transcriptional regulator [Nocardia stercoris]|uniref:Transcriptional regulator n=2 Tax=Nocardia stercoris TaxID=2483361 RepID=A0A3M2L042_9NOCA|nr:transcriptional regulator [Nocardia stercoris]